MPGEHIRNYLQVVFLFGKQGETRGRFCCIRCIAKSLIITLEETREPSLCIPLSLYPLKDAGIKIKSSEEQKRIIQAYVQKVIVYDDRVEICMIVDFNGGGDGIRTRVRKQSNESFYEHSPYFSIHPMQLLRAGFARS